MEDKVGIGIKSNLNLVQMVQGTRRIRIVNFATGQRKDLTPRLPYTFSNPGWTFIYNNVLFLAGINNDTPLTWKIFVDEEKLK